MKKLSDIRRIKFYLWIGLGFLLVGMLTNLSEDPDTFWKRALDDGWRTVYVTAVNYVLFEYSIPRLGWKRFIKSFLLIVLHIFMYSFGLYVWRYIGIRLSIYSPFGTVNREEQISVQMGFSVGSVLFFGIVRHIYNYIRLKQTAQQLKIEKQQAELNYLKSQTNPHFLFNTLNNIYSLARDKSDLAPESILRLSKMLRYMLYETSGPFIAIAQEVKIITDYIALEKLRYDDSLRINFNHDIEDMKQSLPPLLLIPLVENAFKHGVSETRSQPFVDLHLSVNKRHLTFIVKNSSETFTEQGAVKENIGLSNLRRQLELLYNEYNLSVEQSKAVFTAILKIDLASHA
ncbi:MAG: Histidine kinase [Chitinophagaceae bacterium]|nr:Histidine kinase [Chitinophagaceae bacterium]